MKIETSKLLDGILKMIYADLKRIKKENKSKVLDAKTSTALCRYASVISDINAQKEIERAKVKKQLESRPTEELIKAYQENKNKEKK